MLISVVLRNGVLRKLPATFFFFFFFFFFFLKATDGMQLWSGIPAATLFESYVVESLNANQVAFELQVENLDRALKSAQFSTECMCKLTKKNGHTYLTFIVEIQSSQIMSVVQDVPIRLLSPSVTNLVVCSFLQSVSTSYFLSLFLILQ
jgi:hypothetical protein